MNHCDNWHYVLLTIDIGLTKAPRNHDSQMILSELTLPAEDVGSNQPTTLVGHPLVTAESPSHGSGTLLAAEIPREVKQ